MRRATLAALTVLATVALGWAQPVLPPCGAGATLSVWVDNEREVGTLDVLVEGELDPEAVTCAGNAVLSERYRRSLLCSGRGLVRCGSIGALRPGTWIHRMQVGSQRLVRRTTIVAPEDRSSVANPLVWPVYGFVRQVSVSDPEVLRSAVAEAAAYTAGHPAQHALVLVRSDAPIVLATTPCPRDPVCTRLDPPKAGLCLVGDRLVLDGRGEDGRRGARLVAGAMDPLLRIYGSDVEIRGFVLEGSQAASANQADTVDFMHTARRSAVVDCLVLGPSAGDGVGAQCAAGGSLDDANLVIDSEIRGARDKGVKVTGDAWQVVSRTCVRDNANGGVQATLGGHAVVRESIVQHNLPGSAEHGIFAVGTQLDGPGPSSVMTRGNIVRFNGNRGLSLIDDARGDFRDDYVARNEVAGIRIETTRPATMPRATLSGVATVCNQVPRLSGVCTAPSERPCVEDTDCEPGGTCKASFPDGFGISIGFAPGSECACADLPCACTGPEVSLGDGSPGGLPENAINLNRGTASGANLQLAVPGAFLAAGGTQWEGCGDPTLCTAARLSEVAATNLRLAPGAAVDLAPLVASGGKPIRLDAVSPARPRAGEIVRVFGSGFDAINGTALARTCHDRPAENADFCDPSDPDLAAKNRASSGNRLRLVRTSPDGTTQAIPLDLVAVTPTMLAFRMPHDCYSPMKLRLSVGPPGRTVEASLGFCDPEGCAGQPAGIPCADDGYGCTLDRCDGDGSCRHELLPRGQLCRAAAGPCDEDEFCTGTEAACPPDAYRPAGHVCRPAADLCDAGETCNGRAVTCPPDALRPAGAVCRPSGGPCDVAERCDGVTTGCPPDARRRQGTVCRPSRGACDLDELCDGVNATCPPDLVVETGAVCRPAGGPCDLEERCDGVSPVCPADAKRGETCRPARGPCDVAEVCDGTSDACPPDLRQSPATVCRPSSGACDREERCDGVSDGCPPDTVYPLGAVCRQAVDACDIAETCDGDGHECPPDARRVGYAAVECVLGQLEATARAACLGESPSLLAQVSRTAGALQRSRMACARGQPRQAWRSLRRVAQALERLRQRVAITRCRANAPHDWAAYFAAARAALRTLRRELADTCRAGGG